MFFKYWLTLNECAKFINKHFNLFDENQVTENDIIDLALDERIELAIRVKYVDNNQFQTYSSELKINSSLTRLDGIQDNSVEYTIYSGDDSVMECINGEFYAKGIYKIIITESLFLDDTVIFQAIGIIDKENSEVVNFSSDTYPPSTIFFENKIELLKSSLLVQSRQLTDLITEIEIQNSKFIERINFHNSLENTKSNQTQSLHTSEIKEYEGAIPPKTDQDKLAHFIELIIQKSEFMKDGRVPTYSELHTMLGHKYPHEAIPSKNTIKKYLGQH